MRLQRITETLSNLVDAFSSDGEDTEMETEMAENMEEDNPTFEGILQVSINKIGKNTRLIFIYFIEPGDTCICHLFGVSPPRRKENPQIKDNNR